MNRTEIEAFVRRWLALVCAGDLAEFDQILAETPRDLATGAKNSRELFRERASAVRRALAGLEGAAHDLVIDGERIAWRFTLRGVHQGPLFGQAPSGKRVELRGVNFQRLSGGVVTAHYTLLDAFGFIDQVTKAQSLSSSFSS